MRFFKTDCDLIGVDMPAVAPDHRYRALVTKVRDDVSCAGVQVTSHKVRLYRAASSVIDRYSEDVSYLEEVGGLLVRTGTVTAVSPDAMALRRELMMVLGHRPKREIVILGGGGAARAIAFIAAELQKVSKVSITEADDARRLALGRWLGRLKAGNPSLELNAFPADANDNLVSSATGGAVIINATGLGKDSPGSPLSDHAPFPCDGVAWDLNYRGERHFLTQASRQATERRLAVRDGFSYFVDNWTCFLESALRKNLSSDDKAALGNETVMIRRNIAPGTIRHGQ
jgi:shikimate 5-dehydrogenase